jgi:hypothetical protein
MVRILILHSDLIINMYNQDIMKNNGNMQLHALLMKKISFTI